MVLAFYLWHCVARLYHNSPHLSFTAAHVNPSSTRAKTTTPSGRAQKRRFFFSATLSCAFCKSSPQVLASLLNYSIAFLLYLPFVSSLLCDSLHVCVLKACADKSDCQMERLVVANRWTEPGQYQAVWNSLRGLHTWLKAVPNDFFSRSALCKQLPIAQLQSPSVKRVTNHHSSKDPGKSWPVGIVIYLGH